MGSILTDNGGEFNADEMREVMSILNVRVLTTAAESPFQNGLCERVHAVTDMMLLKLEEENKRTDSQTLLCWANMARNALQMWNGYSSHQLIFGKNPNLPGIMTDGLPGLEGSTSSEIFAKHLNALHSSRRAYIETEANERIRRALRGKIRAAEDIFEKGDTVYYKREGKERWLGPATVVFQEGKVVFVRHGGIFVRVSPNRIERVNEILERHESGDAVQTEHKEGVVETNEEETEEESPVSEVIAAPVPAEDQNYEAPDRNSENQLSVTDQELQTVSSETATGSVENDRDTDRNTERSTRVKVNDNIRYKLGDEWVNGTIISRAGKASGKYKMLASILGVKPRTVMIEAYVDNKSIIEAILSTRLVEDKRLRVDVAAIKESLQLHDVKKIQWVPGHLQLANPMTKQGASGFNLLKVLQSGKMLDELC